MSHEDRTSPPRLRNGSAVQVRSDHVAKLCDSVITKVAGTLAFLPERDSLGVCFRRNHAAIGGAHLNVITEYFALTQNG